MKEKSHPNVSICIPAYQQPEYLHRLLQSIINQSYSNYEIIVTDDSLDLRVEQVVSNYNGRANLTYLRNPERLGSPQNWNAAMRLARGKWIKMMHHDDWFTTPDSLETFVSCAEQVDTQALIFSQSNACNASGQKKYTYLPPDDAEDRFRNPALALALHNLIGGPSATMFRRDSEFHFDANLIWLVDIDAYIRLLVKSPPVYIRKPLVNVSLAENGQLTAAITRNRPLMLAEHIYLFKKNGLDKQPLAYTYIGEELRHLTSLELLSLLQMRIIRKQLPQIFMHFIRERFKDVATYKTE